MFSELITYTLFFWCHKNYFFFNNSDFDIVKDEHGKLIQMY